MVWLKFYEKERKLFPVEYRMCVASNDRAELIVKKLCRHFKISSLKVTFKGYSRGHYFSKKKFGVARVDYPRRDVTIAYIVHEVAHHYNEEKYGTTGHTKKLMRTMKRMMKYCIKKDYWGLVINRDYAEAMAKADEDGIIVKAKERKKKNPLYGDTIIILAPERNTAGVKVSSVNRRIEQESEKNSVLAKELRFQKNEVERVGEYTWIDALSDIYVNASDTGNKRLRRQCLRLYEKMGMTMLDIKPDVSIWYDPSKAGESSRIENSYGIWNDEYDKDGRRFVTLVEMKHDV